MGVQSLCLGLEMKARMATVTAIMLIIDGGRVMRQRLFPARLEAVESRGLSRKIVGGFLLYSGGIHLGIVAAGSDLYASFANEALFPAITGAWNGVFMSNPSAWGLLTSFAEAVLGVLLLHGGTGAKLGWIGVIAFHMALMLFGWGFWLWSIPALAFLVPSALKDWQAGSDPGDLSSIESRKERHGSSGSLLTPPPRL